jgi:hypothetical protein
MEFAECSVVKDFRKIYIEKKQKNQFLWFIKKDFVMILLKEHVLVCFPSISLTLR